MAAVHEHTVHEHNVSVGVTLPLGDLPLHEHRSSIVELGDLGVRQLWAGEANGLDAVVPVAAAAAWDPRMHIGTSILPAFTRGPGVLAMTAASLSELAPHRTTIGIGASSPVVVRDWNAVDFAQPYQRTADVLDFLRSTLGGERVARTYDTFDITGFELARPPAAPPAILLAALRPKMLSLAARRADGAITTWVAPQHTATIAAELSRSAEPGVTPRLVVWVTVAPSTEPGVVRQRARRLITSYLNVPAYAEFHRWLGNDELLEPMWREWSTGNRRAALDAVSDELVDQLIIHGPPEHCIEQIDAHLESGATEVALSVQAGTPDPMGALRLLAGAFDR